MADNRGKTARSIIVGGLSGGIFFFGLALAIFTGHFWTGLLVTLAFTALVGSLSSNDLQGIYGGFQGFVFLLGLAVCSVFGWWPWILVVLGISSILGTLHGLVASGALGFAFPETNKESEPKQQTALEQPYQEGYQSQPVYQEGSQQFTSQPYANQPQYEQPQVVYPQELPPQQ